MHQRCEWEKYCDNVGAALHCSGLGQENEEKHHGADLDQNWESEYFDWG